MLDPSDRSIDNFPLVSFFCPFKYITMEKYINHLIYLKVCTITTLIKAKLGQTAHKKHFLWLQDHQGWSICHPDFKDSLVAFLITPQTITDARSQCYRTKQESACPTCSRASLLTLGCGEEKYRVYVQGTKQGERAAQLMLIRPKLLNGFRQVLLFF